jgi:hypothetical protein
MRKMIKKISEKMERFGFVILMLGQWWALVNVVMNVQVP